MLQACAGKAAEDITQQTAAEPELAPPPGLSLRERIAAAGQPEAEARLDMNPTDPERQTEQSSWAPIQEPLGQAMSPSCAPTLPRTLQPDPAAELQGWLMLDGAHHVRPGGPDTNQAVPGRAQRKGKLAEQPHAGSIAAIDALTERQGGSDEGVAGSWQADPLSAVRPSPSTRPPSPRINRASLQAPGIQQCTLAQGQVQMEHSACADIANPDAAQTAAAQDMPQRSAQKRRSWPWLQQMLRDAGPALVEPISEHAEPASWEGQPASAEDPSADDQAPLGPNQARYSSGHAGSTSTAAPFKILEQKQGRQLMDEISLGPAPAPVAAPSLSLAERMRLAQAENSMEEYLQLHTKPSVPQQQRHLVRQPDAAAAVPGQHDSARDPLPRKSPGEPQRQRLQTGQQQSPWEAAVQPRQAPPKFSEGMHKVALSQQPLLQRLRRKSRSPDAHPELESSLKPLTGGAPAVGSRAGVDIEASQEPLAQRLNRKRRSPEAHTGASGQPALKKAGHKSEASVQQIRDQGKKQTPGRHILTDTAPEHDHDGDTCQDQLQTPHVHGKVQGAALVPQRANLDAGEEATPELQWRRPKPHRHVLEDSSGKVPPSQSHSKRPQQPEWGDDSQRDQAAHCTASELGTALTAHASSAAAAAAAAGNASTGLQWRRPLARRPQNVLDISTPGMHPDSHNAPTFDSNCLYRSLGLFPCGHEMLARNAGHPIAYNGDFQTTGCKVVTAHDLAVVNMRLGLQLPKPHSCCVGLQVRRPSASSRQAHARQGLPARA